MTESLEAGEACGALHSLPTVRKLHARLVSTGFGLAAWLRMLA